VLVEFCNRVVGLVPTAELVHGNEGEEIVRWRPVRAE